MRASKSLSRLRITRSRSGLCSSLSARSMGIAFSKPPQTPTATSRKSATHGIADPPERPPSFRALYNIGSMERKELGKYIVADPEICHGKPTFIGTRIFVSDILNEVGKGKSWDAIVSNWRGDISIEAIAEAVHLAQKAFDEVKVSSRRDVPGSGR